MKRKLKSVSFNEAANKEYTVERMDAQFWHTFDDLLRMKYSSVKKAMSIREAHSFDLHNRSSYSNTVLQVYLQCCGGGDQGPSASCVARLAEWTVAAPTLRGLEFQSVHTVRMERAKQRQRARQAVLACQEELYDKGQNCGVVSDNLLRKASESCSGATKLFARAMAEADALAVQKQSAAAVVVLPPHQQESKEPFLAVVPEHNSVIVKEKTRRLAVPLLEIVVDAVV
jgi:hypothetical protein